MYILVAFFLFLRLWGLQASSDSYNIDALLKFAANQEGRLVVKTWKVNHAWLNPSVSIDPENYDRVIMIWRMPNKGKLDKIGYFWLNRTTLDSYKKKDMLEHVGDNFRTYLIAEDARIFSWNGQLYIVYNTHLTKLKRIYFAPVFYHSDEDMFFVRNKPFHLYIEHEFSPRHQKNWSPFEYCPDCVFRNGIVDRSYCLAHSNFLSSNMSDVEKETKYSLNPLGTGPSSLLFIYSINPHRILKLSSVNYTGDEVEVITNTVFLTKLNPEYEWKFGEMRGGSPALRINNDSYLTFFHSSGRFNWKYIVTYYMGAYLFESKPPFRITHISSEPIIAKPFINESLGWSYKYVDYVIFPMGFTLDDNYVYVSVGKNDQEGWMIQLNRTELMESLKPVESHSIWPENSHQHQYAHSKHHSLFEFSKE